MLKLFLSYFASALPQEYYYDYYSQIRLCAPAEPLPTPRHPSTRKTSTRQQANQAAAAAAAAAERASGSLENTLINNTLLGRDMTVCLAAIWVADCLLTELKSGQLQRKNIERYISFACAGGRAHEHSNEHPTQPSDAQQCCAGGRLRRRAADAHAPPPGSPAHAAADHPRLRSARSSSLPICCS